MGVLYRLQQFLQVTIAYRLPEEAWPVIEANLTPEELALFRSCAEADRAHSYRVLRTLQNADETDRRLLAAALLHDVGKSRAQPTLWDRVLGSLGELFLPQLTEAWGDGDGATWRRPFVIRRQHAAWGAQMAREAGSHPTTVRLIRHHQENAGVLQNEAERRLLERLQWADDQN